LGCEKTREALVIDPGDDPEAILEVLRRHDLKCRGILHTHAHLDHVSATSQLAEATGAPILLHVADQPLYDNVELQAQMFGFPTPRTMPVDRLVADGDEVAVGDHSGEVLHTPGHSPGSLCLHMPESEGEDRILRPQCVFAGDTLFFGSIGRTDLWGGDYGQIIRSIHERLLTLPDETIVIPGHGPQTTIGKERAANPFLMS
jgi:glyoxylase-like metal-dependent hydrolase (beta-lactamase superfamily II)